MFICSLRHFLETGLTKKRGRDVLLDLVGRNVALLIQLHNFWSWYYMRPNSARGFVAIDKFKLPTGAHSRKRAWSAAGSEWDPMVGNTPEQSERHVYQKEQLARFSCSFSTAFVAGKLDLSSWKHFFSMELESALIRAFSGSEQLNRNIWYWRRLIELIQYCGIPNYKSLLIFPSNIHWENAGICWSASLDDSYHFRKSPDIRIPQKSLHMARRAILYALCMARYYKIKKIEPSCSAITHQHR